MRKFITTIRNIIDYPYEDYGESFFVRIIALFIMALFVIAVFFGAIVLFLTVPIWIIPYAIYYCLTEKGGTEE